MFFRTFFFLSFFLFVSFVSYFPLYQRNCRPFFVRFPVWRNQEVYFFFYFSLFDVISIPWCVLNGAEIRKIKMLAPAICSFLFCSVAFFILMAQFLSVVFFLPMTFSLHFDWSKMLCAQDKNEPIAFYYFHKI